MMMDLNRIKKVTFLTGCLVAGCNQLPPPITTPVVLSPHQIMVQSGDTLYGIASHYNVSLKELMELNHLATSQIQPGQILALPKKPIVVPIMEEGEGVQQTQLPSLDEETQGLGVPGYQSPRDSNTLDPHIAREIDLEKRPTAVVTPMVSETPTSEISSFSTSPKGLIWPVRGNVLSQFSRKNGKRSDGIKIASKEGAPVKAAASGTVLICQKNYESLGDVLIVKSSDGSLTAYGHLESFKVQKGDTIQKGDVIGAVGKSGDVKQPQLYFEVRKALKKGGPPQPVDPLPLLGDVG